MATVKLWPNGLSGGHSPDASLRRPGKRGRVKGWTAGAARRNMQFLWSVAVDLLSEDTSPGYALTLTVADCPPTADEWRAARERFLKRAERLGMMRYHWVTEWTRRGVPHMHAAIYGVERADAHLLVAWLDVADAAGFVVNARGQDIKPISGALGWLQYVAKHASRGVAHYQHQGAPEGWETTGRLWGYGGEWPRSDEQVEELSAAQYSVFRRLVWDWMLADMERRGVPVEFIEQTRDRWANPEHGEAHGVSGWIPGEIAYNLLLAAKDAAPPDHPWEM